MKEKIKNIFEENIKNNLKRKEILFWIIFTVFLIIWLTSYFLLKWNNNSINKNNWNINTNIKVVEKSNKNNNNEIKIEKKTKKLSEEIQKMKKQLVKTNTWDNVKNDNLTNWSIELDHWRTCQLRHCHC